MRDMKLVDAADDWADLKDKSLSPTAAAAAPAGAATEDRQDEGGDEDEDEH